MARKKLEEAAQNTAASVITNIAKTPEEQAEDAERLDTMQTRGKKGLKVCRFNAAFSPDNFDYLKVMSALKGYTATEYLNELLQKDKEDNAEQYGKAKAIMSELRS